MTGGSAFTSGQEGDAGIRFTEVMVGFAVQMAVSFARVKRAPCSCPPLVKRISQVVGLRVEIFLSGPSGRVGAPGGLRAV